MSAKLPEAATNRPESKRPAGAGDLEKTTAEGFRRSAQADADHFFRFSEVESESADDDKFEVQVAFSSESPVLRMAGKTEEGMGIARSGQKYYELLSHRDGEADFSALNRTGAFLDEHQDAVQLGAVRRARLSKDNIGRAVLGFDGASELSKTRYKQMKNRSRPHISFGYTHTKFIGDEGEKNGVPIKRIAFAADEISSVARPADPTVGVRRAASGEWACLGCGDLFAADKLDANYECPDCRSASRVKPGGHERLTRLAAADEAKKFRAGAAPDAKEISFNDLKCKVSCAADCDKRFKTKRENGNVYSDFYVHDVCQNGAAWSALIVGPGYTIFKVAFEFDGETVTLGDAVEVQPVTSYEPVGASRTGASENKSRSEVVPQNAPGGTPVDSGALATAGNGAHITKPPTTMNRNLLLNTDSAPGAAAAAAAVDEPKVRADEAQKTRVAVENEFKTRNETLTKRNGEINALADDFCKTHGMRWNGKPGEVFVCADRIRSAQIKACNAPADQSAAEVRADFKRAVHEILEGSREPKNPENVAHLPGEVSERCSIGTLYRAAARAQLGGDRSPCFMPKEGAELEAHKEIHLRSREFPDGAAGLGEGCILPINMPSRVRGDTKIHRLQRDAAASDFATAGALIAPDYRFPTIELLRNLPALSRAGMTLLTGLMGGGIVLPRQEGATTAQSIAENTALTAYDQIFGQIKMAPHRVGSKQNYSRLALLQTSDDFEGLVMADHMAQVALWIDAMGLNGSGGNSQPLGILNQQGIGSVMFGGVAATAYAKIIAMETAIRSANIYEDISFITTSTARGTLRVTPATLTGSTVVSGTSNAIWTSGAGGEQCIGRTAVDSQQVPGNRLIALVGRHLVMAQWGGIAVVLDTLSQSDKDQIRLCLNTYVDFALRHAQAVCASADSASALA